MTSTVGSDAKKFFPSTGLLRSQDRVAFGGAQVEEDLGGGLIVGQMDPGHWGEVPQAPAAIFPGALRNVSRLGPAVCKLREIGALFIIEV